MSFKVGGLELESSLMNAGGVVKTPEDARRMALTGVGAVLGGSFTLLERPGNGPNGERVYYHDPETGVTYNALGMPNRSLEDSAPDIKEMIKICNDVGKPFILNFAPTSEEPIEEVILAAEVLADAGVEVLDGFELNASCPNVPLENGERHEMLSYHPLLLAEVVEAVEMVDAELLNVGDIWVRVSPFRKREDAAELVWALKDSSVEAIAGFNTFLVPANGTEFLQVKPGVGGMSGPGMCAKTEIQTKWLAKAVKEIEPSIDIIGCNGVSDGETMAYRMGLGASAVGMTTLFFESLDWGASVNQVLEEYAEIAERGAKPL